MNYNVCVYFIYTNVNYYIQYLFEVGFLTSLIFVLHC
jgi:hypothetical protein